MAWDLDPLGLTALEIHGANPDNLLIRGENFSVMRRLLPALAGSCAMVYIDPPFNTGQHFDHYADRLASGAWLAMMEARLPLLREFLRPDGVIFVHLDDSELAYCKVAMDRIFGRDCYITTIVVQAATPSSFKTVNPGPADVTEYLLMYCRDRAAYRYAPQFRPRAGVDLRRFSRYVVNFADPPEHWRFGTVRRAALGMMGYAGLPAAERVLGREQARALLAARMEDFALRNAERVFEAKTLQRPGRSLAGQVARSREIRGVLRVPRDGRPDLFLYRGRQLYFLARSVREIGGRPTVVEPMPNLWTDIPTCGLHTEGGVDFRYGKKPERLLARLIGMAASPGDLVLDAFAGSGTAGAVAHKLGRRWIMIEEGPQAETHALPRLRRVVSGADPGGVTAEAGWTGGGGFLYCAPAEAREALEQPAETAAGLEQADGPATVVAAAVIRDGERFFLAQRQENRRWEFPGGKVRPGEDPRAALHREIREELALDIAVEAPLEVVSLADPQPLVIIFFSAHITGGEPQALECRDFAWVDREELGVLPLCPADRRVAEGLLSRD